MMAAVNQAGGSRGSGSGTGCLGKSGGDSTAFSSGVTIVLAPEMADISEELSRCIDFGRDEADDFSGIASEGLGSSGIIVGWTIGCSDTAGPDNVEERKAWN